MSPKDAKILLIAAALKRLLEDVRLVDSNGHSISDHLGFDGYVDLRLVLLIILLGKVIHDIVYTLKQYRLAQRTPETSAASRVHLP